MILSPLLFILIVKVCYMQINTSTHILKAFLDFSFMRLCSNHFNSSRGEAGHGRVVANSAVSLASKLAYVCWAEVARYTHSFS